jgi:hypothetical protein
MELENVGDAMLQICRPGRGWLAGSLHCLTQQQPCDFFSTKFLTRANSKL